MMRRGTGVGDLSVTGEQFGQQLDWIMLSSLVRTYDVQLCLASILHAECKRLFQASALLTQREKGLVWSFPILALLRREDDFDCSCGRYEDWCYDRSVRGESAGDVVSIAVLYLDPLGTFVLLLHSFRTLGRNRQRRIFKGP